MSEDEIFDVLDLMLESIALVQVRFANIGEPQDFTSTSDGVTLLDAISMRLQVIGESVKRIQKKDPSFLNRLLRSSGIRSHDSAIWFLIITTMWIMKSSMISVRTISQGAESGRPRNRKRFPPDFMLG